MPNTLSFWLSLLGFLMCSCSTPSATQVTDKTGRQGTLEAIEITATPEKTTIIMTAPGVKADRKAYTLTDPPRICVDMQGKPVEDLPRQSNLEEGPVEKIMIQDRGPGHTGMVVYVRPEEYKYRLTPGEDKILLTVTPLGPEKFTAAKPVSPVQGDAPPPKLLNMAVIERPDNRTRLSIDIDPQIEHNIKPDGNLLLIDLKGAVVTPQGLKSLEIDPAGGAIESIRAVYSPQDSTVRLKVVLRAPAPYHVTREDTLLMVDFDAMLDGSLTPPTSAPVTQPAVIRPTAPKPPAKPAPRKSGNSQLSTRENRGVSNEKSRAELSEATSKEYAGQKMSFDFVDTDIRNILKLLAEVANLNIVWGTDVEGKISMRLDNVPWDQALEMVLKPNGLTYQIEDEVLWVVPRAKLIDMEIAEKKRKGALMAAKRLQGVFEAKVVEFITVRHRPVADIFKMLVGDKNAVPPISPILDIEGAKSQEKEEGEEEEGKNIQIAALDLYLSYDSGTNMIIANGVRAKVDKVKELVHKLDVPEKQVLIEARIVEATTGFTRDLGIQWQSLDGQNAGITRKWYNSSGSAFDGRFSTNAPANWAPNIGLAFGWLTDGGLGSLALDASLALAEEDQKVNIISAPKVMTVNGGEAFISRGTVEYFSVRTLDTISFEQIPAVLSLKVSPTVSADNSHVTMEVEVTDDKSLPAEQTDTEEGTQESPPGRTEKKITSTLIVKTGDTVVIGGIYQKEERTGDSGIPFLKDIPLLGWLFKAERKERGQTELLIFLTPTVVKSIIEKD